MKTINNRLLTILFLLTSTLSFSQYQNVMISDVSKPNEPSICINPRNPNQLVAGTNTDKYFVSSDGGYTWYYNTIESPGYIVWGDPCIIVDTTGNFYYLHLSYVQGGPWIDRIYCQKYNFNNDVWSNGSYMGKNGSKAQDKPWATVDSSNNNIYVTWTQFDEYGTSDSNKFSNIHFSKSTDAGKTWSIPKKINKVSGDCVDSDETTEGAVPAVGPNGEIYVAWAGPAGIVFNRSFDEGETWLLGTNIFINSQPGGWDYDIPGIFRANGLPITCCDISNSENRGTIYVNWSDQRNGPDDTDVWLSKSTDGGNTWSDAIRVNDDPPGKQQFFTWMTIDQTTGEIVIVFYDRRNYDNNYTDVYIARSTDGGESFDNVKISESPFLPSRIVFFGDYTNITAFDGKIRPIWTRADGISLSVWTAIIDVTTDVNTLQDKIPFSLAQNYPNPFKESTYISYKLLRNSKVTLSVYDIFGRRIALLDNNKYIDAGEYVEQFNARNFNLSPGVYYFTLQVGNIVKKQKMILSN